MQKVILNREHVEDSLASVQGWIGTDRISTLAVTSEDSAAVIENVFDPENHVGWRASEPGEQTIRILFREPVRLRLIELHFVEPSAERTQEFVIRWAEAPHDERKDIVRQRWNFSPQGSIQEHEAYRVNLDRVAVLELVINPDVSRPDAIASLAHLRMA
jgi:hypothetical protein